MSTCGKQKREKLHGRQEGTGSLSSFAATKPITSVLDLQIRSGISILSALQIENTPSWGETGQFDHEERKKRKKIYSGPWTPRRD